MTLKKEDLSDARVAWQIFSRRRGIIDKLAYATQGWHEDSYMMPETIVDKLGVRSNTDKFIDVPPKGNHARGLGFVYLTGEENKSALFHIKNEFFNTFPRGPLFIGLGHTFLAAVITPLNIKKRPTLWYEGLTGRGKSELTILLQQFFGKFENLQNWTGTEKGIIDYCHRFKDAILVIDDYKAKDRNQIAAAAYAIQYGYDGGSRASLTKNSEQRGDKGSRCLMICSGEDTPFGDASVIARMLLVPYPKTEMKTKDLLDRCKDNQHLYSGVMAHFIHYFLNHDINNIKKQIRDITDELLTPVRSMQNAPRICENFGMNYIMFKMFVEFMEFNQILNKVEVDELKLEHLNYARQYRDVALSRCASEQQSSMFIGILREVVQSNRMSIAGLQGHERENVREIGFVRPNDDKHICIYPNLAIQAVKESSEAFSSKISQNAIGEQLVSSGVIDDFDAGDSSKAKMINNPRRNSRGRVWMIKADALGITDVTLRVVQPQKNTSFPFDTGGLI